MPYPPPPQPPLRFKYVDATLDYGFDLAKGDNPWLAPDETVTTLDVTSDAGLTFNSKSIDTNSSGVPASQIVGWFSGGEIDKVYYATFAFTTSAGRTDARTMRIKVVATR